MPAIEDMWERLKDARYKASTPVLEDKVQDATPSHMLQKISGPWLFSVAIQAAEGYYAEKGIEFHGDMGLNLEKRLFALARVVAHDWADAAPIAKRAMEVFIGRTQGGYLWRVMTNLGHKIYKKQEKRNSNDDVEELEAPSADELEFDHERCNRILLSWAGLEKLRPEVLAVYVASRYAFHKPGAIVAFFANLTPAELCGGLLRGVCPGMNAEDRKIFEKPLADAAAKAASAKLGDIWNPLRMVSEWISRPPAWSPRGPSAHRRLAHVAVSRGSNPAQIVAGFSGMTIGQVAERLHEPIVEGAVIGNNLGDYYDPRARVTKWIDLVLGRMKYQIGSQTSAGIRSILGLNIAAERVLVFLLCHCLGVPVEVVSREYGTRNLAALELAMEQKFCEKSNTTPAKTRSFSVPCRRVARPTSRTRSQAAGASDSASAMQTNRSPRRSTRCGRILPTALLLTSLTDTGLWGDRWIQIQAAPPLREITAYLLGDVDPDQAYRVEMHLADCEDCTLIARQNYRLLGFRPAKSPHSARVVVRTRIPMRYFPGIAWAERRCWSLRWLRDTPRLTGSWRQSAARLLPVRAAAHKRDPGVLRDGHVTYSASAGLHIRRWMPTRLERAALALARLGELMPLVAEAMDVERATRPLGASGEIREGRDSAEHNEVHLVAPCIRGCEAATAVPWRRLPAPWDITASTSTMRRTIR